MIKLIIFDLDGTLLNTIADLTDSTNYVLRKFGFPEHSEEKYKYFVGNGIETLIRRACPQNIEEQIFLNVLQQFLHYYEIHKADKTAPYAGMIETLETLQNAGVKLAVATNKTQELLPELFDYYFPTIDFCAVLGNRKNVPVKPHPQIVEDILEITKVAKSEVLYVGDTAVDMETAMRAHVKKIGVMWGFRTREELEKANADVIIEHPLELLQLL